MPEVSIVVRAFNEERHLPALFDALDRQDFRDFEVVLVDSGSFDRTREIAAARGARVVKIASHDFTFGHSLNAGIKESAGRFIVVVSAHTQPVGASWLGALVAPLSEEKTAMVYGRQMTKEDARFSERMDFERMFGPSPKEGNAAFLFVNNANSALRRELWEQHAFDPALPGLEDVEWAKFWTEQGWRVVYAPRAALYHIHDESWSQVRRRFYREGQAAKWMAVIKRRSLARQALGETAYCVQDWIEAARTLRWSKFGEIARYRWEKFRGRVAGVLDGAVMDNPLKRERLFFDKTARGVVIDGPGSASFKELGLPDLKPGEILIRVAYEAVCATDLEVFHGRLGYYRSGLAHYPIVPGHEFSGTVAGIGAKVSNIQEGDRVVVECIQGCGECPLCRKGNPIACAERREVGVIGRDGGYAEYMTTPARFAHKIPAPVTLAQACLCEPLAVVHKGLRRLERGWGVSLGDKKSCAVIGAGPIGHLAARVLESRGHPVTVFDRNPARLKHFSSAFSEMGDLSAFDALIEATGDPDVLEKILHSSKPGATILLLGLPYARREFSFESVVGYDKTVVGSVGSSGEDFDQALVALPKLDTRAFFEAVLPLSDYAKAWALAESGKHLKVVLKADPWAPESP